MSRLVFREMEMQKTENFLKAFIVAQSCLQLSNVNVLEQKEIGFIVNQIAL